MTLQLHPPRACELPYTISQINRAVAGCIEEGNTQIWFRGEVSGFRRHSSGHCYLRLKDHHSQIPAVLWRSSASRLTFLPEDGMEVTGTGSLRVWQKGGYYQLDIQRLAPDGAGALHAAFEALKKRLCDEGLFDEGRKKPIPRTIRRLGVVTSRSGAALHDICTVVARRSPGTGIVLVDVRVQGAGAAHEIAEGIRMLDECGQVDAMIVGRGGGSIEDLWAFNEEVVARAIAACCTPLIAAVGHETDVTIADFCADLRAPTPSAAAERAVADSSETARYYHSAAVRCLRGCLRAVTSSRSRYEQQLSRWGMRAMVRVVGDASQGVDAGREQLERGIGSRLERCAHRLSAAARQLDSLSPLKVLSRGYAVVEHDAGGVVTDASTLCPGQEVTLRLQRGRARATICSRESLPAQGDHHDRG